jgi:DNA-binding GntR family transcriptional regulator
VAGSLTDRRSFRSTKERAYWSVRESIISAVLEPGQKVSESEIASQLGVSRTPAREALAALREEGLVAIVPQLGTYVTPISEAAVADAVFAREALECAAMRLAAEAAQPADLTPLYANLEAQEQARVAGHVDAFDALDAELHQRLCDLSGHGIAWTLSRRVSGHLERVRKLDLRDPEMLAVVLQAHRDIVAAVAANDPEAVEARLRSHLRRVLSTIPALRRRHPGFFDDAVPDLGGSRAA